MTTDRLPYERVMSRAVAGAVAEQNFLEKFVPIQPSIHDNLIEAFEDKIW